ncbi:hypothetical protein RvY_13164-1 [Ramazzottius varieornatus]|uniref:Uncharacterized protein n=1 Tax=Ramazzottius varieornatus TaxID=947166 RepID=A0A1D1VR08_RAMVA|nr:hypothetical protein RvY_13164-1 [Ramazzottius varieornatus]
MGFWSTYRFNHQPRGKKVKEISLRLPSTTFRDGKVRVLARTDYTVLLDTRQQDFRPQGWDGFIFRVELSGMDGRLEYNNAYQNAHLPTMHEISARCTLIYMEQGLSCGHLD